MFLVNKLYAECSEIWVTKNYSNIIFFASKLFYIAKMESIQSDFFVQKKDFLTREDLPYFILTQ